MSIQEQKTLFRYEIPLVFACLLVLFATTLSENLSISHDSIFYRQGIIYGFGADGFFHPHHILFTPLASAWYSLLIFFGLSLQPHIAAELLNALCGALTGSALYFLMRLRGRLTAQWSIIGIALACGSFGFWYHSVCLEVCIPPLMWFTLGLVFLTSRHPSTANAATIGAFHALAILFHQVYVFLGFALLLGLWKRDGNIRQKVRETVAYLSVGMVLTLSVYGYAAMQSVRPFTSQGVWRWVTAYAHIGTATDTHFYPPSAKTPLRVAVGEIRAVTPMYAVVKVPEAYSFLKKLLPYKHFDDEEFLYRDISPLFASLVFFSSIIVLCGACFALAYAFRRRYCLTDEQRKLIAVLISSVIVFTIFFSVWDSFNVEFWILQTTYLWVAIIVLSGAKQPKKSSKYLYAALAFILVLINSNGAIIPLTKKYNDFYRYQADLLWQISSKNDVIFLDESYPLASYISSFTPCRAEQPYSDIINGKAADSVFSKTEKLVRATIDHGHNVIVFPFLLQVDERSPMSLDAADVSGGKEKLQQRLDSLWSPYRKRFVERNSSPYLHYFLLK